MNEISLRVDVQSLDEQSEQSLVLQECALLFIFDNFSYFCADKVTVHCRPRLSGHSIK